MDAELNWRKATYSGSGGGGCVEAANTAGTVLVRDTTNRAGGTLEFRPGAWNSFLSGIRRCDVADTDF